MSKQHPSMFMKRFPTIASIEEFLTVETLHVLQEGQSNFYKTGKGLNELLNLLKVPNQDRLKLTASREFVSKVVKAIEAHLLLREKGLTPGVQCSAGEIASIQSDGYVNIVGRRGSFNPLGLHKVDD